MKIDFGDYSFFQDARLDSQEKQNINFYSWAKANPDDAQTIEQFCSKIRAYNRNKAETDATQTPSSISSFSEESNKMLKYGYYKFDNAHFQDLIDSRRYTEAADYAAQYHFKDPEVQKQHENDIINLRRDGRILGAVYSKIDNNDTLNKVDFANKVFIDGGLELIPSNPYTQKFIDAKRRFGSLVETNAMGGTTKNITKEATAVKIIFYKGKQTALGMDWLAGDNPNTFDNYLDYTGFTKKQLQDAGIEVIEKDGNTSLKFDKTNPLANLIIKTLPRDPISGDAHNPFGKRRLRIGIIGYDADGNEFHGNVRNVPEIEELVNSCLSAKKNVFSEINATKKDYSSTIGPALDDTLEQLNAALNAGQITQQEYNKYTAQTNTNIKEAIKTMGSRNLIMYSNWNNSANTDESLSEVDNLTRGKITQLLSNVAPNRMHINSMISNGQIGVLITLDAEEMKDEKGHSILDENGNPILGKRYQIFIPHFMEEQAQAKINQSTSTRSIQEINAMQDWDYEYKTSDGDKYSYYGPNEFLKNGEKVSKQEALNAINKDMIIDDAVANLKFEYLNKDDELTSIEGYEQMARLIAVKAANELYPDVDIKMPDGKPVSIDDIFAHKVDKSDQRILDETYTKSLTFDMYDKVSEIFDIYNKIMSGISYYNN